jgi:hypothetical protein
MFVNKILSKYIHVGFYFEEFFLQQTQWCNQNLIWTFGLAIKTLLVWWKSLLRYVGEVGPYLRKLIPDA